MMRNNLRLLLFTALMVSCMPIPSIDDDNVNNNGSGDKVQSVHPIACYTFDGSADDVSGNGYSGVLMGNPDFIKDTPDGSSGALKLNAFKEQYVNIPYDFLRDLSKYSFSVWIKDFTQGVIFSSEGGNHLPLFMVRDNQEFMFYNWAASFNNYYECTFVGYDCTSIMSSEWHNLVVTAFESEISLYVDGRKIDSLAHSYSTSSSNKVCIGGNAGGEFANYMTMKIDNVMFFDYCLTDSEVKYIYNNKL